MSSRTAVLLGCALAASHASAAGPRPPRSADVYRVDPVADGAVLAAATAATLVPWLLEDRIIDLRCPCDPSEVPRWERFAIGNASPAADLVSNVTLAAAAVGPAVWSLFATRGEQKAPGLWG